MAADSSTKKEEVAPAAAPEPEAPENPLAAAGGMKQLAMLPMLWMSGKVDWTKPENTQYLLIAFGVVVLLGLVVLQATLAKIAKTRDTGRVANPGEGPTMPKPDEDGSVSVMAYDAAKVKELKTQFMMSCGISTFLHIQWGYTQPLLILCIMQPMTFWENPALQIHWRGKSGPGYERPFAKPKGNPLQDWADKKKKEMEDAAKEAKEEAKAVENKKDD